MYEYQYFVGLSYNSDCYRDDEYKFSGQYEKVRSFYYNI